MEKYQTQLTKIKKALKNYQMLSEGDYLAIGLSGGKDSMSLLYLLNKLMEHSHLHFTLCAIHIDYGWESAAELTLLEDFAASLNVPYHSETIQYPPDAPPLNCAICSRVRRGALIQKARALGCQKIALGHHLDDAVQTVLLNLTQGGRFRSFSPTIAYPEHGLTLIRPLIYVNEQALEHLQKAEQLPVIDSHCPLNTCSKRTNAGELLQVLEAIEPQIKPKILHALEHLTQDDAWIK